MPATSMYVRITSPIEDRDAKEMYDRFMTEGCCHVSLESIPMGLLCDAKEVKTNYVLTLEITNPKAIEYIRSLQMS